MKTQYFSVPFGIYSVVSSQVGNTIPLVTAWSDHFLILNNGSILGVPRPVRRQTLRKLRRPARDQTITVYYDARAPNPSLAALRQLATMTVWQDNRFIKHHSNSKGEKAMKYLNNFLLFDLLGFLMGKVLTVVGCIPWVDFSTGAVLGTKVEVAITRDDTEYPPSKDGSTSTNLYEKLSIKVPKELSIPIGATVEVVDGVGAVYGEYRNQLSIKAADVRVVAPPDPPAKGAGKAVA